MSGGLFRILSYAARLHSRLSLDQACSPIGIAFPLPPHVPQTSAPQLELHAQPLQQIGGRIVSESVGIVLARK